ncbi:hypothetical protein MVEN_01081700 [Mycena venus]|uniref:Uncharacterized protein n=1 Tax=Mycena venus TaxID=2733690 RepID=A0A8H7D092_9AGAR|nr:hypothetical protein MVEN_01081700 [Mycena venus]
MSSPSPSGSGSSIPPTSDPASSLPPTSLPSPPPPPPPSSISSPSSDTSSPSSQSPSASSQSPSTTSQPSTTSSASPSTTNALPSSTTGTSTFTSLSLSTGLDGSVVTHTQFETQTFTNASPTASGTESNRAATKGFLQNKGAVAAVFTIVGLVAAGVLFALVTSAIRRRRAKRFDREIAEEAKRARPTPRMGLALGGGYSDHVGYGAAGAAEGYASGHGPSSDGYTASHAVHSGEGTPSNYMYPSGYSDLGFSEVSSHGTYSQPPMDAAYNHQGGGRVWRRQGQVGQDWHAQGGQAAYVYPGEEHTQPVHGGYPPTATTANSSGSDGLGRSKSGARSLVDSYNAHTPGSEGSASAKGVSVQQPQYADGYVSQYQTHPHVVEDSGAYGGMESHHGHVVGLEDDEESKQEDGRRVLKVANE